MADRREFLKACAATASGIFFSNCAFASAAFPALQTDTARKRREIVVGASRIRTVDLHGHVYVAEAWDLVKNHERENPVEGTAGHMLDLRSVEDRLAQMDEYGIDVQVVGINPNWHWADRALAGQIIRVQNATSNHASTVGANYSTLNST